MAIFREMIAGLIIWINPQLRIDLQGAHLVTQVAQVMTRGVLRGSSRQVNHAVKESRWPLGHQGLSVVADARSKMGRGKTVEVRGRSSIFGWPTCQ